MRRKHVAVARSVLRFDFTGKSGKQWKLRVENKRIAAIVKRCAEMPGHELFKYLDDDGQPRTVDSGDVNAYIKEITGEGFSAKDFRTWAGTVRAAWALAEFKTYDSHAEAKRNVVAAIENVSKQLGNTPAICSKCYVHPEVLNAYMSGDLVKMIESKIAQKFKRQYAKLTSDEIMVLAFLGKRLGSLKAALTILEMSASLPCFGHAEAGLLSSAETGPLLKSGVLGVQGPAVRLRGDGADAGGRQPDDRTCRLKYLGLGHFLAAQVARPYSMVPNIESFLVCLAPVLLVADLLHPIDGLAVEGFRDRDVRHRASRCGAVPVLLAGCKPDDVARPDLLDRPSLALHPAEAEGDEQGLTERMGVPGRASAGFESDGGSAHPGRRASRKPSIQAYGAREVFCRSLFGGLRAASFDVHRRNLSCCGNERPVSGHGGKCGGAATRPPAPASSRLRVVANAPGGAAARESALIRWPAGSRSACRA
jgi:DNA topoisomerase I-like protein